MDDLPKLFLLVIWLPASSLAAEIDFSHEIVPVLRKHCVKCHTGDQKKGGFSLNDRASLLRGGESGPVVVSGKSAESELVARVTSDDPDLQMPPEGPRLSAQEVARLIQWVDEGVAWEPAFSFAKRAY